jgi:hypothetical protein
MEAKVKTQTIVNAHRERYILVSALAIQHPCIMLPMSIGTAIQIMSSLPKLRLRMLSVLLVAEKESLDPVLLLSELMLTRSDKVYGLTKQADSILLFALLRLLIFPTSSFP